MYCIYILSKQVNFRIHAEFLTELMAWLHTMEIYVRILRKLVPTFCG
jgi:hypothetical protein